ncbi:MAG: WYL domain-containing protein [Bacteroidia bacterium]|nr:WYL domain-containing protein [Bacteroidia bacterium]
MPVNKNLLIRIITLDRCLRDFGKEYYIEDLMEACSNALSEHGIKDASVSKRTIYNDIEFMKSEEGFGAPIENYRAERNRIFYRYTDLHYSIMGRFLPQNVVELSRTMVEFLQVFDGIAPIEEIKNQLPELAKFYKLKEKEPFVEFDFNYDYSGLTWFGQFFSAISNKTPLEVEYESYHRKKVEKFIFHPAYLKAYMNRWYAIGYNETEQSAYWVLGLERVRKIKPLHQKGYIQKHENLKDYFYDVVGVTKEKHVKPEIVRLCIHPEFEKYILTRPFHPSQKNKGQDQNGWRIIQLELIINEEFINHLMPYIHFLKIMEPPALAERINSRIADWQKNMK